MPPSKPHFSSTTAIKAVLFDLDGTLLDTAPDIYRAINITLSHFGYATTSLEIVSRGISHGATGIFQRLLGKTISEQQHNSLLEHFLGCYQVNVCLHTTLFPGITELLGYLQQSDIRWGVVTNKSKRFTLPILKHMKLDHQADCIISGDSTDHRKPHPAPVLLACKQLNLKPQQVLFVGDHAKDICAGHSAGTCTVFAKYGYSDKETYPPKPFTNTATHTIESPTQLIEIIDHLNRNLQHVTDT